MKIKEKEWENDDDEEGRWRWSKNTAEKKHVRKKRESNKKKGIGGKVRLDRE